jgi:pyruvate/2-oxoglutarate dehydrogenase complex dihydrolipoamide dehydrogenase (E3) component
MADQFDVICIGAGTVGEAVSAQLEDSGLSLAVVEKDHAGGECAYWGCIPSKTLLRSAEVLAEAARARELSASRVEWEVDFPRIARRTHWMARDLDDSTSADEFRKQGATLIRGEGHLVGPRTVTVGDRTLTARRGVVIATGTAAAVPPVQGLDAVPYWTNREAVMTRDLPASLTVLGGGPIGAELAQAFARFGTTVHVVEALDRLLAAEEPEAGRILGTVFAAEGITVSTSAKAVRAWSDGTTVTLDLESGETVAAEKVLVAVGRTPNLAGFDLDAAGVRTTDRGWVQVDGGTLQAADGIWAGGDITGIGAFTHLAWYHGTVIGRRLRGIPAVADHRAIPRVTFTDPEVASVGMSEAHARETLASVRAATEKVEDGARGAINGEPGGVVKLVVDGERDVLVGALAVGPRSGEIIAELTLAIRAAVPVAVLADTLHPFPTFSRILDGLFAKLAR